MYNLLNYEGVVLIEEIDKKTGKVVQSKCFNNLTPHGLQVVNNGGVFGMALNSLHRYMNEGATYVKSFMTGATTGTAYEFEFLANMLTIVGYNLESEPTDKRFPPHLNSDLTVDNTKVHWYGSGKHDATVGDMEAKLVAPRIKSDDGIRRIFTYEVSTVGTTNAIGIMFGKYNEPYKGGQSATVITPVLELSSTSIKQMDSLLMPNVPNLTESNEILFGVRNDEALGIKNLDDGSWYWLEDGDPRKGVKLSKGHCTHCVVGNYLYITHSSGRIYRRDLTNGTEKFVSQYNTSYPSNLSTDGEFIYEWSNGGSFDGTCRRLTLDLVVDTPSLYKYTDLATTSPDGLGKINAITYQHGKYYVYYGACNLLVACTDILNIKGTITGYWATNCMIHLPEYNCFLGVDTLADFTKIRNNTITGGNCETGGIKRVPDNCGSQFNFIWDVKCNDGTPFTVTSSDNPVYVSYGFRGSNSVK